MNERADDAAVSRREMLRVVAAHLRDTADTTGRDALSPRVAEALLAVPRHEFVHEGDVGLAHADAALAIGCGQTISQPFIVAVMTELADVGPQDEVLEVGTGSGYQAAVLSRLARRVTSIERVPELAASARERLARLGYAVDVRVGDGALGCPERAPFDAILVTCGADEVPPALLEQLAPGGRLLIPVQSGLAHELMLVTRDAAGRTERRALFPVAFVPLVRD